MNDTLDTFFSPAWKIRANLSGDVWNLEVFRSNLGGLPVGPEAIYLGSLTETWEFLEAT